MKLTVAIVCAMATALLAAAPSSAEAGDGELKVGYYDNKCSGVEDIVRSHVIKAIIQDRGIGGSLIRLIFHDCFVRVYFVSSSV
jgi:peroxidase